MLDGDDERISPRLDGMIVQLDYFIHLMLG